MGCLLASIAVHLTVDRGVHLVSDLVPALAANALLTFQITGLGGIITSFLADLAAQLNIAFSGYLLIRIATELTAEFGWLFAATFLPREQSECRKHLFGQQYARQRRPQRASLNPKMGLPSVSPDATNRARSRVSTDWRPSW
jgi:hypothetical protein